MAMSGAVLALGLVVPSPAAAANDNSPAAAQKPGHLSRSLVKPYRHTVRQQVTGYVRTTRGARATSLRAARERLKRVLRVVQNVVTVQRASSEIARDTSQRRSALSRLLFGPGPTTVLSLNDGRRLVEGIEDASHSLATRHYEDKVALWKLGDGHIQLLEALAQLYPDGALDVDAEGVSKVIADARAEASTAALDSKIDYAKTRIATVASVAKTIDNPKLGGVSKLLSGLGLEATLKKRQTAKALRLFDQSAINADYAIQRVHEHVALATSEDEALLTAQGAGRALETLAELHYDIAQMGPLAGHALPAPSHAPAYWGQDDAQKVGQETSRHWQRLLVQARTGLIKKFGGKDKARAMDAEMLSDLKASFTRAIEMDPRGAKRVGLLLQNFVRSLDGGGAGAIEQAKQAGDVRLQARKKLLGTSKFSKASLPFSDGAKQRTSDLAQRADIFIAALDEVDQSLTEAGQPLTKTTWLQVKRNATVALLDVIIHPHGQQAVPKILDAIDKIDQMAQRQGLALVVPYGVNTRLAAKAAMFKVETDAREAIQALVETPTDQAPHQRAQDSLSVAYRSVRLFKGPSAAEQTVRGLAQKQLASVAESLLQAGGSAKATAKSGPEAAGTAFATAVSRLDKAVKSATDGQIGLDVEGVAEALDAARGRR